MNEGAGRTMQNEHRKLFWAYLGLAAAGTALPYSQFLPWFAENGLNLRLFFTELFSTRIGGFFGWDVIVSTLVLLLLVAVQGRRDRVPHLWFPVAAAIAVGVSSGLPLFLALRERALEERAG
jgi:uncharacterized protein DUF2834